MLQRFSFNFLGGEEEVWEGGLGRGTGIGYWYRVLGHTLERTGSIEEFNLSAQVFYYV